MYLRSHSRSKDGKAHAYWSLVETVRTPDGPRQRTLCYLGELNSSAQARWVKTVEVFNEQGDTRQLKLFPSHVEPPEDDSDVARVLLNKVRLERTRTFGSCFLGLELWKRLELDRFFEEHIDQEPADVPWSRVAIGVFNLFEKAWQRSAIRRVALHHLIGQRQPIGGHHQRDHQLQTVRSLIPAVAAFGFRVLLHLSFEVRTGQI